MTTAVGGFVAYITAISLRRNIAFEEKLKKRMGNGSAGSVPVTP